MQDGMKILKWDPRSRGAQFVGYSPLHANRGRLVRNLRTGNISPQFHVVYDEYFKTVHASSEKEPEVWPELITFQSFRTDIEEDDENYNYELEEQWLSSEELEQKREHCLPGSHKPQRELSHESNLGPKVEPQILPSTGKLDKKISVVKVPDKN